MGLLRTSPVAFLVASLMVTGCAMVDKCRVKQPEPPGPDEGMEMIASRDAVCLSVPEGDVKVSGNIVEGARVKVVRSAAGRLETWVEGSQWCGWVEASALVPEGAAGTRGAGLVLAPLLVAAGKYVVSKIKEWVAGKAEETAEKVVCGAVEVLKTEGDRVLVQTKDGLQGWAEKKDMTAVADVRPVTEDKVAADLMEGGSMPGDLTGLVVEARVVRPGGVVVLPEETLHLGEEYDLQVRCSSDCYIRITCETPGADAICQYHPSQFPSFEESRRLAGGQWNGGSLLPQGVHFKVSEPVAQKDLIRVEANTYSPYRYVKGSDKGEGCLGLDAVKDGAATGCTRGAGFSTGEACKDRRGVRGAGFTADANLQPQAEAVAKVEIRTAR